MAWGKEWPVGDRSALLGLDSDPKPWPKPEVSWQNANKKEIKELGGVVYGEQRELNNLSPTHDPYTNPGAMVYYQCNCGAILDPKTKSFAALNNAAMNAGWKVRWKQNGEGYQPFCVKCGEGVE